MIEGTKWCGKTSTAKQKAASVLFMQDPDYTLSYLKAADTKPSLLQKGDTPRLIDEWQMALGDATQFVVYGSVDAGESTAVPTVSGFGRARFL